MKSHLIILVLTCCFNLTLTQDYKMEVEYSHKPGSWSIDIKSLGAYSFDYPEQARENHIKGIVWFKYDLSDNCKMENVLLTDSLGYGLDEIAEDIIRNVRKEFNRQDVSDCPRGLASRIPVKFDYRKK